MHDEPSEAEKSAASDWITRNTRDDEAAWRALARWMDGADLPPAELAQARGAARRLADDEERVRSVLGRCPKAIAVLDQGGGLVGFNRAFCEVVGCAVRVGAKVAELLEPPSRAMLEAVIGSAGTTQPAAATVRINADGQARDVEFLAATIPSAGDVSVGVVLAAEDRTAGLRDDVERVAAQWSVAAADHDVALGLGAAALVHDLGNMVATANMALAALGKTQGADAVADADAESLLADARAALEQATRILQDVRNATRARQPAGASSDVADVVATVARLVRESFERARVTLETRVPRGLEVALSRSELTQVLTNLLDNAAHAVEEGGGAGRVTVLAERVAEGAPCVAIRVRDDGVGIESSRLATVFDPFETTRVERGGTGLGLAIVKRLVEGAGGRIQVLSLPERGSEFVVTLPAAT